MIRKTAFLITGTVAGVVGVVSYNPPQLNSAIASAGDSPQPTPSQESSSQIQNTDTQIQPAPTKSAASSSVTNSKSKSPASASTTKAQDTNNADTTANQASPTPVATQSSKQSSGISGTYKGETSQTRWGPVQVQVTINEGRITNVSTLQYPNGDRKSLNISSRVIPWLQDEALQIQSAQISGISGATYTSDGFKASLASALQKAGL